MALLKSKVKSFLSGFQKEKNQDDVEIKPEDIHQMQPTDLPHSRDDPRKTEEIIQDIEDHYFDEGEVDCSQHELEGLVPDVDMAALEDRIFCLKTRDTAVYRKIYDLVFANYTAYVQELENVTMLQVSLQDAAKTCVNARRNLKSAREGVSQGGLGLLGKHRKRERLRSLLDILRTLKTLQRTDARLKVLLEEGDYPAATQLCIECQKAIETYKLFSCVSELSISLQDVQQDIEQELERALSQVTMKFSAHHYQQVQQAYEILGKTQTAVDTLMMKFTTSIHDQAYAVVAEYVKMSGEVASDELHLKAPYASLCKLISSEHFIPCLMEICQVFWRIMFSYRQVKQWHSQNDIHTLPEQSDSTDMAFDRSYVKTKLENGLLRVWRDVQQKVRPYILALDMSHFKYDDFIRVLDTVSRLISIGVEFCGEGSSSLQESMRQQSLNYFKNYHRARLEELKIFLETEAWELCPVRSTFSLHQLREFRFLKSVTSVTSPKKVSPKESISCFSQYSLNENPFSANDETEEEVEEIIDARGFEDTVSDDERNDDEDVSDELKRAYVDEQTGEAAPSLRPGVFRRCMRSSSALRGPLLANTTLTVLRFFGNYMQMMNVLHPIAFDVLECLSQLFDYYLYGVYDFFVKDLECLPDNSELSTKLSTSLKRISESFNLSSEDIASASVHSAADQIKIPKPLVNPVVPLADRQSLFGLSCRMVAVESLWLLLLLQFVSFSELVAEAICVEFPPTCRVHLAKQFETLLPYMESMIPETKMSFLRQFVSQTVQTVPELRKPVYHGVAMKALPCDQILHSMSSVKWDIKEIKSQHSGYVDRLIQEFAEYQGWLAAVDQRIKTPAELHHMLWEGAAIAANRVFVEGFSQARKCSNEGRALMQLDFQQYRTKVEKLSNVRPLHNHGYVEDYIKAYYLSETDTEEWIRKHTEYTTKQLLSLVIVGVGSRITKRSRQRLLTLIDETEKRK